MYKKTQHYLLVHYPLLWNVQIVPALLVIVLVNLFFFLMNYALSALIFESKSEYFYDSNYGSDTILMIVLTSLLFTILWMRFYKRNNGLKSYYPKTSHSLYKEWLLVLLIVFGFASFFSSFYQGEVSKRCTYASTEEAADALETIREASALFPPYLERYDSSSIGSASQASINAPSTTYSLLNHITDENYPELRKKLIAQDKEYIENCFKKYFALEQKWNLHCNTSATQCMNLLYHPPLYKIDRTCIINHSLQEHNGDAPEMPSLDSIPPSQLYTNLNKLESFYKCIQTAQDETIFETYSLPMYFAFGISLFIIGFRVSSRKCWFTGIASMTLLGILVSTLSATIEELSTGCAIYCSLFLVLLVYIYYLILNKRPKGFSKYVITSFIILTPVAIFSALSLLTNLEIENSDTIYLFHIPITLFSVCCAISILLMWPVLQTVQKWKGLPEE